MHFEICIFVVTVVDNWTGEAFPLKIEVALN